jgi:hypothetical protein
VGKAARIRARHAAEDAGEIKPNQRSLDTPTGRNRQMRRAKEVTQRYSFHRNGTPKVRRPSAEPFMGRASRNARLRNGVSRGRPTNMLRRDDPRSWTEEPAKGARRSSWRAQWTPGAIFRTISGKRWVDLEQTREPGEAAK